MELKIERPKPFYTLLLTEEEALWLEAVCQNPIGSLSEEEEDEDERQMRLTFFNLLKTNVGI